MRFAGDPPIILDLCGGSGAWSDPYREAGYDVRVVTLPGCDVREYVPPERVHGVLAAPPCTEFASSGARWWNRKDPKLLADAVEIVLACLRIVERTKPEWWALENPVGRLRKIIGPPLYSFQPWEYGDPWFKRTLIWGWHVEPRRTVREAPAHDASSERIWRAAPGPERAAFRSVTPPGFARAFFKANR